MNKCERSIYIGTVTGFDGASVSEMTELASNSAANSSSGHGFMAEDAQTLIDRLHFRSAEVVGGNNAKDGADRLCDGQLYQTKFYSSGKGCVRACFDKDSGLYRYYCDDGAPMPVEVPKNMYSDAVHEMENKIAAGRVPGVTDPIDAAKYVKASDLTYENARRLCIPGTAESLFYDITRGAVFALIALVISGAAAFIAEYRSGRGVRAALVSALRTGFGVFGISLTVRVLCAQLMRTELFHSLTQYDIGRNSLFAPLAVFLDKYLRGAGGNPYSSFSGALNRLPRTAAAAAFLILLSFLIFIIPDLIRWLRGRITRAELGRRAAGTAVSKAAAVIFMLTASALLLDYTVITGTAAAAICMTAAMLGGMTGQPLYRFIKRRDKNVQL